MNAFCVTIKYICELPHFAFVYSNNIRALENVRDKHDKSYVSALKRKETDPTETNPQN